MRRDKRRREGKRWEGDMDVCEREEKGQLERERKANQDPDLI